MNWRTIFVAGTTIAILSMLVAEPAVPEGKVKSARKLEKAERNVIGRDGGYFPVLIRLKNGTLAAVVRMGARHLGVGGRLDLITSRDGGSTWCDHAPIGDGPLYAVSEIAQVAERTTSDGRRLVRVNYQTRFTNAGGVLVGTATGTSVNVGSVE